MPVEVVDVSRVEPDSSAEFVRDGRYPSPDGSLILEFREASEMAMGGPVVGDAGLVDAITGDARALGRALLPWPYQPWIGDAPLMVWIPAADADRRRFPPNVIRIDEWRTGQTFETTLDPPVVRSVVGSRRHPRLLACGVDVMVVTDDSAEVIGSVAAKRPIGGFVDDEGLAFSYSQAGLTGTPTCHLIDSETGELLEVADLSDAHPLIRHAIDSAHLIVSAVEADSGTRMQGPILAQLLPRPAPLDGQLHLMVFVPTGEVRSGPPEDSPPELLAAWKAMSQARPEWGTQERTAVAKTWITLALSR